MAIIYTILELADAGGNPTGKFRHVSYSDEVSEPVYYKLIDKTYDSRGEAENCPEAKDALDRIFHRGKYLPLNANELMIVELGAALAKARRALRLAETKLQVVLHLPDDAEFRQYTQDTSAADVGCGGYWHWRQDRGLLTPQEMTTRNVDPDAASVPLPSTPASTSICGDEANTLGSFHKASLCSTPGGDEAPGQNNEER